MLLEHIIRRLIGETINMVTSANNGNLSMAITHDYHVTMLAEIIREDGHTLIMPTRTTHAQAGIFNGRSIDVYAHIIFITDDADLIQILQKLHFKQDKHCKQQYAMKI